MRLALDKARRAFVSRNEKQIIEAAIDCGELVLEGFVRSVRHDRRMRSQKAARANGDKQTAEAALFYEGLKPRFESLVQQGMTKTKARETIREEISSKRIVSIRSLQKWLK